MRKESKRLRLKTPRLFAEKMNFYENLSDKKPVYSRFLKKPWPGARWVVLGGRERLFKLKQRLDGEWAYVADELNGVLK